jgi:hypothetical protein
MKSEIAYLIPVPPGRLPVYFRVGGLARFRDNNQAKEVGIHGPVSVSCMFDRAPVDIFAEAAPAIDVSPAVRGEITSGIGVRSWFW